MSAIPQNPRSAFSRELSSHSRQGSDENLAPPAPTQAIRICSALLLESQPTLSENSLSLADLYQIEQKYSTDIEKSLRRIDDVVREVKLTAVDVRFFPQITYTPTDPGSDGRSPINVYGPPPSRDVITEQGSSLQRSTTPDLSPGQDDDLTYCEEDFTPWKEWEKLKKTPSRSRHTSTATTPSKCLAAESQASSPLPVARTDCLGHIDRWYKRPTDEEPGIIIESHQGKHMEYGQIGLWGPNPGSRGSKIKGTDTTEQGFKSLLDRLLTCDDCLFLRSYPEPGTESRTKNGMTVATKKLLPQYTEIRFNSFGYDPELRSWTLHLYPLD